MKIAQITPGSGGGFYCENCLRDLALVKALRRCGADIIMIPMYLPLPVEENLTDGAAPIFFGGVNVFLQQKMTVFRKTPRWIDGIFDRPGFLRWIGSRAGMTRASDLGEMTISMLSGEQGRQKKELSRLIEWLAEPANRPDMVCLSNVLLAGLVRRIKDVLGCPVVSLLQDEDGFVDGLGGAYSKQAWRLLAQRAGDIDAFVVVSRYYADVMQARLALTPEKVHIIRPGISLNDYRSLPERKSGLPTIGFLSRMCFAKGLDILIDAFIKIKRNGNLPDVKLRIAGGQTRADTGFIRQLHKKLESVRLEGDVDFATAFDSIHRAEFLSTLSVLCVPERYPAAYAMYALEALAAAGAVVAPASGVFPELSEITGGVILYEPNDASTLARTIEHLLLNADQAAELGRKGRMAVFERFDIKRNAAELLRVYETVLRDFSGD
ncbi:MAG: glycosyltransferase family 4 protein [Planctomycetota bacterium]